MPPGLWGFRTNMNRPFAIELFKKITNPRDKYWHLKYSNEINVDQYFLQEFLYKIVQSNVTSHDSFYCDTFGGIPFSIKRTAQYCYDGHYGCCNQTESNDYYLYFNKNIQKCNQLCIPSNHKWWAYC